MRIRRRKKRRAPIADVSLTPLIDTALTVLIIFMIASPMMQNAIRVNLPKGHTKDSEAHKEFVVVCIDEQEQFFVGKDAIDRDELSAHIIDLVTDEHQTVYVKADQSVSYGVVLELVDEIKMIPGVTSVALSTQARSV